MDIKPESRAPGGASTEGIRNRIVIIVGILLVLLLGTGFLGAIQTDTLTSFTTTASTTQENLAEARKQTRQITVVFKDEIHEWKDVLLRGQNKADYEKYMAAFTQKHLESNKLAADAKAAFAKANVDSTPLDDFLTKNDAYFDTCKKEAEASEEKILSGLWRLTQR